MLDGLKRLFSRGPAAAAPAADLAAWAAGRQYTYRPVRDGSGFIVDGRLGALPWRLEWGPSQRGYIKTSELRLRAELGLASALQVALIDRPLAESMERAMFDEYVEGVQTRIDDQTPPEMRWLVMYAKLDAASMKPLRDHFVALGNSQEWLRQWLEGPLTEALRAAPLIAGNPLVMVVARGRLSLRTAVEAPEAADLQQWVRLFESAMREARRVTSAAGDAASTQPSLWSSSALSPDQADGPVRP